jgi:FkbM family methyltransferase
VLYQKARGEVANDMASNGEMLVQRAVLQHVDHPVVFDIGANVGQWSSALLECEATHGVKLGALFVCEPVNTTMARLKEVLGADPRIHYSEKAVGSFSGQIKFHVFNELGGTNSVFDFDTCPVRTLTIKQTTLEQLFEDCGIRHAHLVKIDTEGNDLRVLQGGQSLLQHQRISVVQFEYNHRWVYARAFLRDVFELVKGLPYRVGKVTPSHVELFNAWHPELERFFETNYVCIHNQALTWFRHRTATADASNVLCP